MAINYSRVNWDTTKYVNPTNMNQMDKGIKDACDGVDNLGTEFDTVIGDTSVLPSPTHDICTNISEVNSNLGQKLDKSSVVNNVTSTSTTSPLSANQGKVLNDKVSKAVTSTFFTSVKTVECDSNGDIYMQFSKDNNNSYMIYFRVSQNQIQVYKWNTSISNWESVMVK